MPRRRELADAADGVTGRLFSASSEHANLQLSRIATSALRAESTSFAFDLLDGTVAPVARRLRGVSKAFRADFARHLEARELPRDWVSSAELRIDFAQIRAGEPTTARVQLRIVDDHDKAHTSTRKSGVVIPKLPIFVRMPSSLRTQGRSDADE